MSTLDLLWIIYKWGFVAGFALAAALRLAAGLLNRDPSAIAGAIVVGLLAGVVWPIAIWAILDGLQAECGIFWRREGWKPESIVVLEVLHTEGREMTGLEIVDASEKRVSGGRVYAILHKFQEAGLVTSRKETDEEVEKRAGSNLKRKKYRLTLWKITDAGRRRRFGRGSPSPIRVWDALPRPI